jgi:predicted Holliday junction resolvase-like endonuclease
MLMGDSFLAQSKTANNSWRKEYLIKEAEASYNNALQLDESLKAKIQQKREAVK